MNSLNTYEKKWILGSVIVMAAALILIKGNHLPLQSNVSNDVLPVSTEVDVKKEGADLKKALLNASTIKGVLVKLVIEELTIGDGVEAKNGDTVVVNYIGITQDGVQFDSSYDRGQPFIFKVGAGTVIQGWEKGLIGMKVGGKRILVIPSDMAYGNRQVGVIAPNTPLIFAIELLEIR